MGGAPGQIVILNGAPRSGKSSIAKVIQEGFAGPWMNFGVDIFVRDMTPPRYQPGIGLRPGGERPDLEPLLPIFYGALYESIAAHSRLGINVVTDIGHHDAYSKPQHILSACARRLAGLPVLFVGVRCSLEVIMARRRAEPAGREGQYVTAASDEPVPAPVLAWQEAVHNPGVYDLEIDTSSLSAEVCADIIRERLRVGVPTPTAFERLAQTEV